ncbi:MULTISPECIES: GHMP family kinase ATP-binding protein [Sphingomonas]|uniref:GHMP kinase n=1 Tax=Sphingomonas adhaesiva TaxID=28212 RepID=A0A2A4ICT3_9SPHN|nr:MULTISPECIES: GHMP kinase [Sphingomonas]PCG15976.1 GHMP kinase [Sphingomonas adhaesiva]PZU74684.1 MAG: GHMP kinase [Sphingomonas sp.]
MIISRTPLRISFCGGGSDLPSFYRDHGGAVLSMSIARYVYLSMHDYFGGEGFILKYSRLETPRDVGEIQHRIIREVFDSYGLNGVDFNSSADVPAGTGLGSSSAFTVGLLNLCNAYRGRYEGRAALAARACEIEIEKLGEPIGKQDQYGCALGGLNFIEFHPDESVDCEAVPITLAMRQKMERNLVMFYLGGTRSASAILKQQNAAAATDRRVTDNLRAMVEMARGLRRDIVGDVDVLGGYLHEGWMRKRELAAGITNPRVDDAYDRARAAGASGGKLLGAGEAGFLLAYCPDGTRDAVVAALPDCQAYDVRFDAIGTTIIYSD